MKIKSKGENSEALKASLLDAAHESLSLKAQIDSLTKLRKSVTAKIKTFIGRIKMVPNGSHKEIMLKSVDGFLTVREQSAEKITEKGDIIKILRQLLDKEAEQFIEVQEVLKPNAIQQALKLGLLKEEDLEKLYDSKITKSIILKKDESKE